MKIAFVHDRLLTKGGAENVFMDLIHSYPSTQAKIFTAFSQDTSLQVDDTEYDIISGISSDFFINKIGYRNLMPFFPYIMRKVSKNIQKFNPDMVVISSFAIAKNIKTDNETTKVLYLHSPMQYIRDVYEEYVQKLTGFKKRVFIKTAARLKKWDQKFTDFDEIIYNSNYTKSLAKQIYKLDGTVKYPKISAKIIKTPVVSTPDDYYVYIGRLVRFSKEVDKIIQLFNVSGDNLLIIGTGPDEEYLKSIAKDNIIFTGYVDDDDQKIQILKKSQGLINITKESFGIVSAEALSLGVPVFGYNAGATPELVNANSGILVNQKTMQDLAKGFIQFKQTKFDRTKIKKEFLDKYLNSTII